MKIKQMNFTLYLFFLLMMTCNYKQDSHHQKEKEIDVDTVDNNLSLKEKVEEIKLDTITLINQIPENLINFVKDSLSTWSIPHFSSYEEDWFVFYDGGQIPFFTSGDYNGDGLLDLGALLQQGNKVGLFIFLDSENKRYDVNKFKEDNLQEIGDKMIIPVGLHSIKKGSHFELPFEENIELTLENDGIEYHIFETSSAIIYWKAGQFKEVVLSD